MTDTDNSPVHHRQSVWHHCCCETDDTGDEIVSWCRLHARLKKVIEREMHRHWDLKACDCPLCVEGRAAGCCPDPHREEDKP